MATEVVMPRLGWTMEVGRVVEWLKSDGDQVEAGDLILAIESDKAVTKSKRSTAASCAFRAMRKSGSKCRSARRSASSSSPASGPIPGA